MKISPATANIAISIETHKMLAAYMQKIDGKMGKFADKVLREKIEKINKLKRPTS